MNESYINKTEDLTTLDLVNHLVFISKDEITISSLEEDFIDVTINRIEILKISKFIREDYPNRSKLNLDNITFEVNPNWVTIKSGNNQVVMRPEMFIKIVKYIDEREGTPMNESSSTQNIYNKVINLDTTTSTEKLQKPIKTTGKPIKKPNIYDSIMDAINSDTKGGNSNDNKQQ